ncbi:MAG: hypothetical protein KGL59_11675 [Acidobacteriota bacterium]|nr:hypothetical protein [Acidobacteriota bacterium]
MSARRGALEDVIAPAPPPAAAPRFPGFTYHGGPIVTSPVVYTSFWGGLWARDAAHQQAAARLVQFCRDLLSSKFMNVLSQYGVGNGRFAQSSNISNVAAQLSDAAVQQTIQTAIDSGLIPEPPSGISSQVLIVFLDESVEVKDQALGVVMCEPQGDTAFGYHNSFTTTAGNPFYYAVVPALNDTCLEESCPGNDAGCTLHLAESQEQRRTQVTSHEFAEMVTDPQVPTGWIDLDDANSGENGDICNGETATITAGANTWTVQSIYSKEDDEQSGGASYCLAQAPNPLPPLPRR